MTDGPIVQAARVIVGHCPKCLDPVVVLNDYEVWPYVVCRCGAQFATDEIRNRRRIEQNGYVSP